MKKLPTVFVSSVEYGLEKVRDSIYKIITEEFGWKCDATGRSDQRFWGPSEDACLKRVDACDLYIGLFKERAGYPVIPYDIFYTELEFYQAQNRRKPMRIYVLEAKDIEKQLQYFLNFIKTEPNLGQYIQPCKNPNDLYKKLRKDLEFFGNHWSSGTTTQWISFPFLLETILGKIALFPTEAKLYGLKLPAVSLSVAFDKDILLEDIKKMRGYFESGDFFKSVEVGINLFPAFLSGQLSAKNRELFSLWAEFLGMWAGSCTWLGWVKGLFGALWASKAKMEACRMLEDWNSMHESKQLIANCLYVSASLDKVKISSMRLPLQKEREKTLKQALNFDEWYLACTHIPFPHRHRAHVYLELGDYDQAISDFRYQERGPDSETGHVSTLASLGLSLMIKAKKENLPKLRNEGWQLLQNAADEIKRYPQSPFFITTHKKFAQGLILKGEQPTAKQKLEKLYQSALNRKFFHQAITIQAMLLNPLGFITTD